MSNIKITPVEYGNSVLDESMIFYNGSKDKALPIVFMIYLIETENRRILVDAGCVTMPGFDMKNYIGPINALKNINLSPDDITDVIITHAHHDHIECVSSFEKAVIYIQKDEYEDGKKYFKDGMNVKTFEDEIDVCANVKVVKIGGHSKGSCIVEINTDGKTTVISGDECYLRECLEKKIQTGSFVCEEKSKEFINKYSSDRYNVLLCHDK